MTTADIPVPVPVAAPRTARRRVSPGKVVKETLFYIAVVIVVLIALFPFYWILRTSLLSGDAYKNVFTQGSFLTPLVNSIIVSLVTTVVTVIVASIAGYALARL